MCMYVVICKIDHCIHIHWCIPMGLGHSDPWVESHMWPQQTWSQRSSRGQWPLVQVFGKRASVSTYFDVFSNLILQWLQKYVIAKAGETHGSRTALFFFFFFDVMSVYPIDWYQNAFQREMPLQELKQVLVQERFTLMTQDSIGHLKTLSMSILLLSGDTESKWKHCSSLLSVEKNA